MKYIETVVSLFDGPSMGMLSLNRAGYGVRNYYASEIDKHAIAESKANFPNIQHMGDVRNLTYFNQRLWRGRWDEANQTVTLNGDSELIHRGPVNLLMGGSPCQGFSASGKQGGFDDKRSGLFWHFVRLYRQIKAENPQLYVLLENVKMRKAWSSIITEAMGMEPVLINSALVGAQNRERNYWTNIPGVVQPEDKGLALKDITEDGKQALGIAQRGRYNEEGVIVQRYECNGKFKSNALTTVGKDTLLFIPLDSHNSRNGLECIGGLVNPKFKLWLNDGKILQRNFSQGNRVYSENGKSATLSASSGGLGGKTGLYEIQGVIRKLTKIECCRLQTVPDDFFKVSSDAQAIKMLGNGWTVDVIAHILSFRPC